MLTLSPKQTLKTRVLILALFAPEAVTCLTLGLNAVGSGDRVEGD